MPSRPACIAASASRSARPTPSWAQEMDSPRGRIVLMKQALEGSLAWEAAQPHIDRCLGCLACEPACPSGVPYRDLISPFRALAASKFHRSRDRQAAPTGWPRRRSPIPRASGWPCGLREWAAPCARWCRAPCSRCSTSRRPACRPRKPGRASHPRAASAAPAWPCSPAAPSRCSIRTSTPPPLKCSPATASRSSSPAAKAAAAAWPGIPAIGMPRATSRAATSTPSPPTWTPSSPTPPAAAPPCTNTTSSCAAPPTRPARTPSASGWWTSLSSWRAWVCANSPPARPPATHRLPRRLPPRPGPERPPRAARPAARHSRRAVVGAARRAPLLRQRRLLQPGPARDRLRARREEGPGGPGHRRGSPRHRQHRLPHPAPRALRQARLEPPRPSHHPGPARRLQPGSRKQERPVKNTASAQEGQRTTRSARGHLDCLVRAGRADFTPRRCSSSCRASRWDLWWGCIRVPGSPDNPSPRSPCRSPGNSVPACHRTDGGPDCPPCGSARCI